MGSLGRTLDNSELMVFEIAVSSGLDPSGNLAETSALNRIKKLPMVRSLGSWTYMAAFLYSSASFGPIDSFDLTESDLTESDLIDSIDLMESTTMLQTENSPSLPSFVAVMINNRYSPGFVVGGTYTLSLIFFESGMYSLNRSSSGDKSHLTSDVESSMSTGMDINLPGSVFTSLGVWPLASMTINGMRRVTMINNRVMIKFVSATTFD